MRKLRLTLLLFLVLIPSVVSAKEYHVSVKGSDKNDGSVSMPYKTISAAAQVAQPGDVIITESGGSGAVGSPVDREVDKVRWDVLNEYISAETARKIYKVVIDPKTFEVNYEATSKLRKRTKPRLTV